MPQDRGVGLFVFSVRSTGEMKIESEGRGTTGTFKGAVVRKIADTLGIN